MILGYVERLVRMLRNLWDTELEFANFKATRNLQGVGVYQRPVEHCNVCFQNSFSTLKWFDLAPQVLSRVKLSGIEKEKLDKTMKMRAKQQRAEQSRTEIEEDSSKE